MKELALLELEFLWRVEWRIVPKPEVLVDYYRSLVERSEEFRIEGVGRKSRSSSKGSQKSGDEDMGVGSGAGIGSGGSGGGEGKEKEKEKGNEGAGKMKVDE